MACHGSQLVAKAGKIKSVSDPAVWGADEAVWGLDEAVRGQIKVCGGRMKWPDGCHRYVGENQTSLESSRLLYEGARDIQR